MTEHQARKTVLLVTDRDLRRGAKGNVQRIISLLSTIRGMGCRVLLMTPRATAAPELSAWCDDLLVADAPVFVGGQVSKYDSSAFEHAVRDACADCPVDVLVVEYAWMAPCLEHAPPGCLRVVDAHDVLYERSASFADRGLDPWAVCSAETERTLLAYADVVMAMQNEEAATFETLLGVSSRVMTVPYSAGNGGTGYVPSSGAVVMFVGSWHDGNLGIRDFVIRSWPTIRAKLPHAELRVYGSIGERLEPGPGRKLLGVVDDLSTAYADAALVVCPITAGGGLKIKLIEALDHGRAVVATPLAVRGMPRARAEAWCLADSWLAFVQAVVGLLGDPDRRHRLERAGLAYAREAYSEERLKGALSELLVLEAGRR